MILILYQLIYLNFKILINNPDIIFTIKHIISYLLYKPINFLIYLKILNAIFKINFIIFYL